MRNIAAAACGNRHANAGGVNGFDIVSVSISIGAVFELVLDSGTVVRTDANAAVSVPQPYKLVVETPVFASDFGMAADMAGRTHAYQAVHDL